MTKKHFIALAQAISCIADAGARLEAATAVAIACRRFNAAFRTQQFMDACRVPA